MTSFSSRTIAAFVLLVGALGAAPSTALASPQDLFGFGGRSPGLAMTGTSYAEGSEAVYMNPAGLGAARRRGLYLGLHGAAFRVALDGESQVIEPARGMSIGFQLPLPFGDILEDRLVLGGAFFTPAAALMIGRVEFPEVPQWTVLDRAQVLAVTVALGVDLRGLVDGLYLGVGVGVLADVVGQLAVRLDETNTFSSIVETQLLTTFAPVVGVRYTQPEWGVGATYRHELASRMDLEIRASDLPLTLPVLRVGGIVQYDPSTLLLEGFWRPIPDVMLVVNLTTRFWDTYPGAQIQTTDASSNAPAPGFSAVPSPRAAVEGTWHDDNFTLALRFGYAYEPTPAPPARTAARRNADGTVGEVVPFRILDNDRHVFTLGTGWTIHLGDDGARFVIDVYGQLHVLAPRTHEIGRSAESTAPMVTDGVVAGGGWTMGLEF